jgi:hypothetical protein
MIDHRTADGLSVITDAVSTFHNPHVNAVHVCGDWHTDAIWAEQVIRHKLDAAVSPIILHVGDFGVWRDERGRQYVNKVSKALLAQGMYLYVTLGNHEDYEFIDTLEDVDGMPGCKWLDKRNRIVLLDRPYVWEWSGVKFMSFGGANSVDRWERTENVDWFAGEQISDTDVERGQHVGTVDVMITHEVPTQVDPFNGKPGTMMLSTRQLVYADESRAQLQKVFNTARPKMFLHGHYHVKRARMEYLTDYTSDRTEDTDNRYTVRAIGMHMNKFNGNHGTLTVCPLEFEYNDHNK